MKVEEYLEIIEVSWCSKKPCDANISVFDMFMVDQMDRICG